MRVVSPEADAYFAASTAGDHLEAWAVRGAQTVGPLDVAAWSLKWSAEQQRQSGTVVVADPDGSLVPWGVGDMLGPGGSRLLLTYVPGEAAQRAGVPSIPLGRWRIAEADPDETWHFYGSGSGWRRVSGGAQVTLAVYEDPAYSICLDEIDAEVLTHSTVIPQARALLSGLCGVDASLAPDDGPVPAKLVLGDSRMDAIEDLLDAIDATHRAGPDGSLQIVPRSGVGPVLTLAGGPDGAVVSIKRHLSDAELVNYSISKNATAAGAPLVGRDYLRSGPLAWGGPFGRRPVRHQAVAQTQAGVNADASTVLNSRATEGEVDLPITCLAHPGLQLHDRVIVAAASRDGETEIEGRVVGMTLKSAGGTVPARSMDLTVRVGARALDAALATARHGVIGGA